MKIIYYLICLFFITYSSFGIDEILINSRHNIKNHDGDNGALIISKRLNSDKIQSDSSSVNAITDNSKKFIYRASKNDNSLLNHTMIKEMSLSPDSQLLALIESNENSNNLYLNRIIFFDIANEQVVNAFEYKNVTFELEKIFFLNDKQIAIVLFDKSTRNRYIECFNLEDKDFSNFNFANKIDAEVNDVLLSDNRTFVKLVTNELIIFENDIVSQRYKCRGDGGKLLFNPQNKQLINLTNVGSEILIYHKGSNKYFSKEFFNFSMQNIEFALPLDDSFHKVIIGNNDDIYQLIDFQQLIKLRLTTTKNTMLMNSDKSMILTINPKKEMIILSDLNWEEIDDINFNLLKPKSNTLIERIFFVDKENILIVAVNGQIFKLEKNRNRYIKSELIDF